MPDNTIDLSDIFSEGYGIVPKKLMKSDLDLITKGILCYLLSYTGAGKSECFPSIRKISVHLKISTSTVQDRLNDLVHKYKLIGKRQEITSKNNKRNIYNLSFLPGAGGVSPSDTGVCRESTRGVSPSDTGVYRPAKHNINTDNNNNNNNGIKKPAKRRTPSPASEKDQKYRPLAELLFKEDQKTAITKVTPQQREKKIAAWSRDIRLLFESSKNGAVTFEVVSGVIRWCKDPENFPGEFSWVPNIRSGKKLREKFSMLLHQYRQWEKGQEKLAEEKRKQQRLEELRQDGW